MTEVADRIVAGPYQLDVECPECGQSVVFPIDLDARLTVDSGGSKLRPTLSAKSATHHCKNPDNTEPLF